MQGSAPQHPLRWPVTVLTGMLGSGKTTLLRSLLADPALRGTAVLVNEIGEVGIDHHLIERIDGETVLMQSGCLCCSLKADLPQTLAALRRRWLSDDRFELHRVIIETTGLAEPAPILHELAVNPLTLGEFPLASVIATADAQHLDHQLRTRPESRLQIALADLLVLTKTDLVDEDVADRARANLASVNSEASILSVVSGHIDADVLAPFLRVGGGVVRSMAGIEAHRFSRPDQPGTNKGLTTQPVPSHAHHEHAHHEVGSLTLRSTAPLDWDRFARFLVALTKALPADLLRVKGVLDISRCAQPVVVNGVHDAFYPAEMLAEWPDADRGSSLVLIVDHMPRHRTRISELARESDLGWEATDST